MHIITPGLMGTPRHPPRRTRGRVLLAKIKDVAFNPINIGVLGAQRAMLDPDAVTHLIQRVAWTLDGGRIGEGSRRDGFHGILGHPKITDINYSISIQALAQAPSRMAVARDGFSGNVGCPNFVRALAK